MVAGIYKFDYGNKVVCWNELAFGGCSLMLGGPRLVGWNRIRRSRN